MNTSILATLVIITAPASAQTTELAADPFASESGPSTDAPALALNVPRRALLSPRGVVEASAGGHFTHIGTDVDSFDVVAESVFLSLGLTSFLDGSLSLSSVQGPFGDPIVTASGSLGFGKTIRAVDLALFVEGGSDDGRLLIGGTGQARIHASDAFAINLTFHGGIVGDSPDLNGGAGLVWSPNGAFWLELSGDLSTFDDLWKGATVRSGHAFALGSSILDVWARVGFGGDDETSALSASLHVAFASRLF